jgi:hypothetical protein
MEAECWIKVGLWLEAVGFGLSVIMVAVIKLERIKQIADLFTEIVGALGTILLVYLMIPYIFGLFSLDEKWLFRGRWNKDALDKYFPKRSIWQVFIRILMGIGILIVFVPLTMITLLAIELPEKLLNLIARLFKTNKTASYAFLAFGSIMIFIGLLMEAINY